MKISTNEQDTITEIIQRSIAQGAMNHLEEGSLPGVGTVFYKKDNLARGESKLMSFGTLPILARELALAAMYGVEKRNNHSTRTASGEEAGSFRHLPSYTAELVIHLPELQDVAIVVDNGGSATSGQNKPMKQAHLKGKELALEKASLDFYLSLLDNNREKITLAAVLENGRYPTNRLGEIEGLNTLLGGIAADYGKFLESIGVNNFIVNLNQKADATKATEAYARRLIFYPGQIRDETGKVRIKTAAGLSDSNTTHLPYMGVRTILVTEEAGKQYRNTRGFRY